MRRLIIAAALLCGAPACAQEAEPGVERAPLTAEERAEVERLLDDTAKRGGRGASPWQQSVRNSLYAAWNMNQEPPAPPLQAEVCAAFGGEHELVEVTLSNYAMQTPLTILIPAPYFYPGNIDRHRADADDGSTRVAAWHHDFAPFDMRAHLYSLGKQPNDHMSLLVSGGLGGADDLLGDLAAIKLRPPGGDEDATVEDVVAEAGYDEAMGAWRIPLHSRTEYGSWIAFDDEGRVTDLIGCPRGETNHRCWHEMHFGPFGPRMTYDYKLVGNWRDYRAMVVEFLTCARRAADERAD